jgi:hypothetical protein
LLYFKVFEIDLVSTYRVRDSTTYLLSEGATSVLSPISFLLKGCDKIVSYCPLVPQYEVETTSVSLLSLDTMLTLLDGVGLALLLAH